MIPNWCHIGIMLCHPWRDSNMFPHRTEIHGSPRENQASWFKPLACTTNSLCIANKDIDWFLRFYYFVFGFDNL